MKASQPRKSERLPLSLSMDRYSLRVRDISIYIFYVISFHFIFAFASWILGGRVFDIEIEIEIGYWVLGIGVDCWIPRVSE